jgi:hypothetical protein
VAIRTRIKLQQAVAGWLIRGRLQLGFAIGDATQ